MLGGGEWLTDTIFNLPSTSNFNFLLALWALLYIVQTLLAEIFRGFQDIRLASSFGGGGAITRIILVIILTGVWFYFGYSNFEQIILMTIVSYLITTFLAGFLVHEHLKMIPLGNGSISFAEVINITIPLWISSVSLAFMNQIDVWFLGAYYSVGEVAVYGVVLRLALISSTPGLIINAIMPPIISELYTIGEKNQLERTLRSISTLLFLIASVVFLIFLFFGKSILLLLFGEYYVDGYTALIILTIGQLINISIGAAGLTLIMSGFQSTFMKITLLSGLLSLGLLYFFTPLYSFLGVAIAIAIAKIFQSIIVLIFTHKKTGLWTHVKPILLLHPKSLWRSMR
jgi:O-antigen/teichoic acid export membrane protein